ncbi:hypothetical protein CP8484711_0974B, partial [Chlamydia psittaci 84-8471/1]
NRRRLSAYCLSVYVFPVNMLRLSTKFPGLIRTLSTKSATCIAA